MELRLISLGNIKVRLPFHHYSRTLQIYYDDGQILYKELHNGEQLDCGVIEVSDLLKREQDNTLLDCEHKVLKQIKIMRLL